MVVPFDFSVSVLIPVSVGGRSGSMKL